MNIAPTGPRAERLRFPGSSGEPLAARLHLPVGTPAAYALLAHCFTCSKDYKPIRRVGETLAEHGYATLSFDFTGLGESAGDFSSTTFGSNVDDIEAATAFMAGSHGPVALLVGHSLGGAAVLAAAERIAGVRAVATIAAPSDTAHLARRLEQARSDAGDAQRFSVEIGGRRMDVGSRLVADLRRQKLREKVAALPVPLMIFHSPADRVVDIEEARTLFRWAPHPKSFVSLGQADHLLLENPADAAWIGHLLAAWMQRYL
jgi:alpha-beta hydrolase superfamily lysophospholipase